MAREAAELHNPGETARPAPRSEPFKRVPELQQDDSAGDVTDDDEGASGRGAVAEDAESPSSPPDGAKGSSDLSTDPAPKMDKSNKRAHDAEDGPDGDDDGKDPSDERGHSRPRTRGDNSSGDVSDHDKRPAEQLQREPMMASSDSLADGCELVPLDEEKKPPRRRGRPKGVKDSKPRSRRTREEIFRLKLSSGGATRLPPRPSAARESMSESRLLWMPPEPRMLTAAAQQQHTAAAQDGQASRWKYLSGDNPHDGPPPHGPPGHHGGGPPQHPPFNDMHSWQCMPACREFVDSGRMGCSCSRCIRCGSIQKNPHCSMCNWHYGPSHHALPPAGHPGGGPGGYGQPFSRGLPLAPGRRGELQPLNFFKF